ncbi:MAG: hypothetical protein KDB03_27555 [Planctomycetales bacterium]|nr:hypothetical protein [Planctomycetales bacterium]
MKTKYRAGDWVVYTKSKVSVAPGPRAKDVTAASKGESYSYLVDKFWVVEKVQDDGKLVLKTRRGKLHVIPPTDPQLHLANWWQRWRYASRFREITKIHPDSGSQSNS